MATVKVYTHTEVILYLSGNPQNEEDQVVITTAEAPELVAERLAAARQIRQATALQPLFLRRPYVVDFEVVRAFHVRQVRDYIVGV